MRSRAGLRIACLSAASLLAADALAAEAVRLRPLTSVYVDAEGRGLREPEGVGCAPGLVVVADTRQGRLVKYALGQGSLRATATFSVAQAPAPAQVGVLSDGELVVLDGRTRRIVRVGAAGEFLGTVEPRGPGVEDVVARSFAVGPADRLFILDVGHQRVVVADRSGAAERLIAGPSGVGFLSDVAVNGRGDVFVVDSVARRIWTAPAGAAALEPLGDPLTDDVDFPTSIAVDGEGRLFVVDDHGGGVVVLGRDGSFRGRQLAMGWKNGFVRYPSDVCIGDRGWLFVAERGNNRIQVFEIR